MREAVEALLASFEEKYGTKDLRTIALHRETEEPTWEVDIEKYNEYTEEEKVEYDVLIAGMMDDLSELIGEELVNVLTEREIIAFHDKWCKRIKH